MRTARLRVELEQSRKEQRDYLRQVELARVLDKRIERKRKAAEAKGEVVDEEEDTLKPRFASLALPLCRTVSSAAARSGNCWVEWRAKSNLAAWRA